ncbi:MAG: KTSC domain-containing protein [Betaproteobacteria bacterium]|nr:KTSC domain-containing protein [Betaproteobacteria bacterium]
MDWNWINTPESSNIARFAHNPHSLVLRVEFKNGGIYDYFDVPLHVFEGMERATSRGQYLAREIKGTYRYART